MEKRVRTRLSRGEGRRFGLTVGTAFLVLTALLVWREHVTAAWVTGAVGALLLLGALLFPGKLGPVHAVWMGLAAAISKLTTPIFMGVVYFLVLSPAGVLMRLIGRNPLKHKSRDGSFWVVRETGQGADMRRQF